MHMIFTDEEKRWINFKVFGTKIINECPEHIRKSIENKMKLISNQKIRGRFNAEKNS